MSRIFILGACAAAIATPAFSFTFPLADDAKAFGMREDVRSVAMSPSGNRAAMLVAGPGSTTVLQVADLETGKVALLTKSDGRDQSFYSCDFAGEDWLVCSFGGLARIDSSWVGFSRLIAISVDGKVMKGIGQPASFRDERLRQSDGEIVDWLPDQKDEGSVLMAREYIPETNTTGTHINRTRDGLGVDRLDLRTLNTASIEAPNRAVGGYMTDGHGHVRLTSWPDVDGSSGQLTGMTHYRFRTANSRDWRDLGRYDERDGSGLHPLAVEADSDTLFALKKLDGRDALYRIKLDGSGSTSLVGSDKSVDIDDVVRLGTGQKVVGYTYATDRRQVVYFDPDLSKLHDALGRAVPNKPAIDFEGASNDGQKLLILAKGDTQPGTFYRFNRKTKSLEELVSVRPRLASRTLAAVTPIRVPATDGTQIPAYLTLPPGSSGKNLPAVVVPHGGPSARDEWGFDWLAQFLAARGYAVIQPNYRGSSGYGENWLVKNGFKSWRTSIGDVTAAARYLVSHGIADPNRMAILGWSYGGYAALQSAATEPNLYKAAIAIAPVTDLAMIKRDADGFNNANLVRDFVGTGPHLVEGSPLRQAAKIQIPVLLVHGDRDANVDISQSEKMLAALKADGKSADLVRFAGLNHQLDDSDARVLMLTRIGEFLDKSIGH